MSSQFRLTVYAAFATITAATSLSSIFSGNGWVVPVMVAVVLVSGTCTLVRRSPLPSAFEPVLAAVAILIWLTILDAHSKAHLGFIPGRLAFRHLGHVARHGFTQIRTLPTPAPDRHGLVLVTVVGVAAIALVVDLITVTLRRAALAGLPLLALFTVCAATGHHGVGVLQFIAASIGYLWLLYADNKEKVARWGAAVGTESRARPASAWSTDPTSVPAPATLGRQVGAVAISLGVIVPLAIPGLHTGIDKHGSGGSGTCSSCPSTIQTFDPIVKIGAELHSSQARPVLTYHSTSSDPGYLRLTSLDVYNGISFTSSTLRASSASTASDHLPVPSPPTGPTVTTTVKVLPNFGVHWLPVPSTTLGVSVGDAWRYDQGTATIFSATTTSANLGYTVQSVSGAPTPSELSAAPSTNDAEAADMTLPAISPAVKELTKQVTSGAKSQYAEALDIQRFLTSSRFTYDTSIKADSSPNALADFLLHTKRGFCQQFATSMAVMARLSGIPARVAVGFTRGTKEANGDWLVTTHDAHAWPELWFNGYGWLAFEPTPRGDGQAVTPSYAKGGGGGKTPISTTPGGKTKGHKTNGPTSGQRRVASPEGPGDGVSGLGGIGSPRAAGHSGEEAALLVILALLALALITPSIARTVIRRRRWRLLANPARASDAAWAELRDTAIDHHVPWDDGRSPRQMATALGSAMGPVAGAREAVLRLVQGEEQARYSPAPEEAGSGLRDDLAVVRTAIRQTRTAGERTRAAVMPRSTLMVAGAAALRASDSAGRATHAVAVTVRRRLRALRPTATRHA